MLRHPKLIKRRFGSSREPINSFTYRPHLLLLSTEIFHLADIRSQTDREIAFRAQQVFPCFGIDSSGNGDEVAADPKREWKAVMSCS